MGLLEPYILSLEQLKKDIPKAAEQIVLNNAFTIVDIIKDNQLSAGLDSQGRNMARVYGRSGYAEVTQKYADEQGLAVPKREGDPYNFQWTGSTFDSMSLKIVSDGMYKIFTVDGKQSLLESVYGIIFDLSEDNNQWINENIILPDLYKFIDRNMFNV